MTRSASLKSIPQEVLECIAFCAATQILIGPPSGLPPLLLTCHNIHQALSFEANPHLYARIFSSKFDTIAAFRRLGSHINTPRVLADELKKRWIHLKRIKARTHSRARRHSEPFGPSSTPIDSLWLAYLMMLENDGKNEQQLLDYAEMDTWLMEYWFHDDGASSAAQLILQNDWPIEDEMNSISMWLFWFLLRPGAIVRNTPRFPHMTTIMKLIALAANHYPTCYPSWTAFLSRPDDWPDFLATAERGLPSRTVTHFSETHRLSPPTLAPAAILVFLTLKLQILLSPLATSAGGQSLHSPASLPLIMRRSEDWDTDWHRCINLGPSHRREELSEAYILGSMEGFWEGAFVYTEFTAYGMLLTGAAPPVLDHCLVAHHQQTWRLREYYVAEYRGLDREQPQSLRPGDPLRAHFSAGTRLQELSDRVEIQEPGRDAIQYRRLGHANLDGQRVVDIIILGEGHSAWGQFNLYGRVRPLDGLMSFSKEYVEGDRGRWLYRGYLIGNVDGHLSGRWRDTMSPSHVSGYEGCFVMSRRR